MTVVRARDPKTLDAALVEVTLSHALTDIDRNNMYLPPNVPLGVGVTVAVAPYWAAALVRAGYGISTLPPEGDVIDAGRVYEILADAIREGVNITITPDSDARTVTISSSGGGGGGTGEPAGVNIVTEHLDGTFGLVGPSVTDNEDGTFTYTGAGVTENDDGTFSIANDPELPSVTGITAEILQDYNPNRWRPEAPYLGPRSDAFFLSNETEGDQSAQLAAFFADPNLAGKRRLIGYARIDDTVPVPADRWIDGAGAYIFSPTQNKIALRLTGSNVRICGLSIAGPGNVTGYRVGEDAIYAWAPSAANPYKRISLEEVDVDGFGGHGLHARYAHDVEVDGSNFSRIGYAGVMLISVISGRVEGGIIDTILGHTTGDAYGIAMTRWETDSLITDPRTQDFTVYGVTVRNVPWEGIDTHGGQRLRIHHNTVVNCYAGIAMVPCDGSVNNKPLFAPRDFSIVGNTIDSTVLTGAKNAGIVIAGAQGASSSDPATEYARGSIGDNIIRGHGLSNTDLGGGITARNSESLAISGNTLDRCSSNGVMLYYDNRAVAVSGNTFTEMWSDVALTCAAVLSRSNNNTGRITGNTLRANGSMSSKAYRNKFGARIFGVGAALGSAADLAAQNYFAEAEVAAQA